MITSINTRQTKQQQSQIIMKAIQETHQMWDLMAYLLL